MPARPRRELDEMAIKHRGSCGLDDSGAREIGISASMKHKQHEQNGRKKVTVAVGYVVDESQRDIPVREVTAAGASLNRRGNIESLLHAGERSQVGRGVEGAAVVDREGEGAGKGFAGRHQARCRSLRLLDLNADHRRRQTIEKEFPPKCRRWLMRQRERVEIVERVRCADGKVSCQSYADQREAGLRKIERPRRIHVCPPRRPREFAAAEGVRLSNG